MVVGVVMVYECKFSEEKDELSLQLFARFGAIPFDSLMNMAILQGRYYTA